MLLLDDDDDHDNGGDAQNRQKIRNYLYPLHQYDEKVRALGLEAESGKLRKIVYHPHQQAS